MNNKKGFSYVEMIIVISIVAILMAIAGLSMTLINRANTSKAADVAISALDRARTKALTKGSDAGVVYFVKYHNNLYVAYEDPYDASTGAINPNLLDTKVGYGNIAISFSGPTGGMANNTVSREFRFKQSTGGLYTAYYSASNHNLEAEDVNIWFIHGQKNTKVTVNHITGKCTKE